MNVKNKLTKDFNKTNFELLDCNSSDLNGKWDCIDNYILDFIKELNENQHILTLFSCEGHKEDDYAYLFFVTDEVGWDIFWQKVLPEITYEFSYKKEVNSYNLNFQFCIQSTEVNGINLGTTLVTIPEFDLDWKDKKERFWKTMKEVFLKYYD